jgi:ABC-type branched-subunit amino acid transport system ATPase component
LLAVGRAGEIVGLAGVDENGQSELVEASPGSGPRRRVPSGSPARDVTGLGVRGKIKAGIGHIAEDRHRRGLILDFSLSENLALRRYRRAPFARFGLMRPERLRARARGLLDEYDVRGGGADTRAGALSGGNQQKCVIAREVAEEPKVLIAAQPTRGLDVGAIEFVHKRLLDQRAAGRAGAARLARARRDPLARGPHPRHRVGEIVAELKPTASDEELGLAMTSAGAGGPRDGDRRARGSRGTCGAAVSSSRSSPSPSRSFAGGLVVAVTGANPFSTYEAIFNGTGLNWLFPWISAEDRIVAAQSLQQTLILTTPLHPRRPRGGLRLPGGAVQHRRAGPVPRRQLRGGLGRVLVRRAAPRCCTSCSRWSSPPARARCGRDAGYLKARVGVNE